MGNEGKCNKVIVTLSRTQGVRGGVSEGPTNTKKWEVGVNDWHGALSFSASARGEERLRECDSGYCVSGRLASEVVHDDRRHG